MNIFVIYSKRRRDDMVYLTHKLRGFYPEDNIFYDTDVPVGEDWVESIFEEIRKCDLVLFLVSINSVASISCHSELRVALRQLIPILPIVIDTFHQVYWKDLLRVEEKRGRGETQNVSVDYIADQLNIRPIDLSHNLDDQFAISELRAEIDRLKTVTLTASTITTQANTLAAEHRFREALMLLERRSNMSKGEIEYLKNLILREQAKHELLKLFDIPVAQTHLTFKDDVVRWLNLLGDSTDNESTSWFSTANKVTQDRINYEELQRTSALVLKTVNLTETEETPQNLNFQNYERAIELIKERIKEYPQNNFLVDLLMEWEAKARYTPKELQRQIDSITNEIDGGKISNLNQLLVWAEKLSENYAHLGQNPEIAQLLRKLDAIREKLDVKKQVWDEIKEQVLKVIEQLEKRQIGTDEAEIVLRMIDNRNPGFRENSPEYQAVAELIDERKAFHVAFEILFVKAKQTQLIEKIGTIESNLSIIEKSRFYGNLSTGDKNRLETLKKEIALWWTKQKYIDMILENIKDGKFVDALKLYKTDLSVIDEPLLGIFESLLIDLRDGLRSQINEEVEKIRTAYAGADLDDADKKVEEMLRKYDNLV